MRVFLIDLGVPAEAITDEGKALNTIENIRNVRAIIGNGRVALVTSAYHMPRALQLAARAGLDVGAFPTDYQVVPAVRLPWDNWLPSVDGLQLSNMALREIIALNLDYRRSKSRPMTAFRLNRRAALGLLAGPVLLPLARRARAQTLDKLSFNTDWRAQAEHGGYYQAIAAGLYKARGIELDLRPGGPSLNIGQLLLAGRVDMIMSNSFEAFTFVREQAPFFTIASIFQKDPQVMIAPPGHGLRQLREDEGPAAADLQRQPLDLLALSAQEVRPLRRAAAALQLQHGAVPCRSAGDPAGLPHVRGLFDRQGAGEGARGAADRRRRLQRLPDDDRHLAEARDARRRS